MESATSTTNRMEGSRLSRFFQRLKGPLIIISFLAGVILLSTFEVLSMNSSRSQKPNRINDDLTVKQDSNDHSLPKNSSQVETQMDTVEDHLATEADRLTLICAKPAEFNGSNCEAVRRARYNNPKTVSDLAVLFSILAAMKAGVPPNCSEFEGITREYIFSHLLPQNIEALRVRRDSAVEAFLASPDNQGALDASQEAQRALFAACRDASIRRILKRRLAAEFPNLCETYGEQFEKKVTRGRSVDPNNYLILHKICPNSFPLKFEAFIEQSRSLRQWMTCSEFNEQAESPRDVPDETLYGILAEEPEYPTDTPMAVARALLEKPRKDLNDVKLLYSMLFMIRKKIVILSGDHTHHPSILEIIRHILPLRFLDLSKRRRDAFNALLRNPEDSESLRVLRASHEEIQKKSAGFCPTVQKAAGYGESIGRTFAAQLDRHPSSERERNVLKRVQILVGYVPRPSNDNQPRPPNEFRRKYQRMDVDESSSE